LARQTRRSLSPIATVSRNCANIYGYPSSRRRACKLVGLVLILKFAIGPPLPEGHPRR
jgi:hypothetical protein